MNEDFLNQMGKMIDEEEINEPHYPASPQTQNQESKNIFNPVVEQQDSRSKSVLSHSDKQFFPDTNDMNMLQTIRLNMTKGKLTREHITKCTELAFNTAFKHMTLKCSLALAYENQEVLNIYLKESAALRRDMFISCRTELLSIANAYFDMVEDVAHARTNWRTKISRLKAGGHFSNEDEETFMKKANDNMQALINQCETAANYVATTLMDQVQEALTIRIKDLQGKI